MRSFLSPVSSKLFICLQFLDSLEFLIWPLPPRLISKLQNIFVDVLFHHKFLIVMVKWLKTLQASKKGTYIMLPELSGSRFCPMSALRAMVSQFPVKANAPLFLTPSGPITQSQIRAHLNKILTLIQLNPQHFSFHTFRRSGATLAFNNNVDLQAIKRHGTWTRDPVNAHIVADPVHTASVASSFQRLLT